LELNFTWDRLDDWLQEESREIKGEGFAGTIITSCKEGDTPHVKLFDSGATRHISLYKADFTTYSPLTPPVFLNTANQQHFPAVGTGKLAIHVPNGRGEIELILNDALHTLSIRYTLVSLGALDEEGYYAHISGGYLELDSPHGEHIGHVAHTHKRLYKVSHNKLAYAVEMLTMMELHCRLGHIATSSVHKLIESSTITRVNLDPSSKEAACDACIFACTTRQPVPKV